VQATPAVVMHVEPLEHVVARVDDPQRHRETARAVLRKVRDLEVSEMPPVAGEANAAVHVDRAAEVEHRVLAGARPETDRLVLGPAPTGDPDGLGRGVGAAAQGRCSGPPRRARSPPRASRREHRRSRRSRRRLRARRSRRRSRGRCRPCTRAGSRSRRPPRHSRSHRRRPPRRSCRSTSPLPRHRPPARRRRHRRARRRDGEPSRHRAAPHRAAHRRRYQDRCLGLLRIRTARPIRTRTSSPLLVSSRPPRRRGASATLGPLISRSDGARPATLALASGAARPARSLSAGKRMA
jgi:hypothetical protein